MRFVSVLFILIIIIVFLVVITIIIIIIDIIIIIIIRLGPELDRQRGSTAVWVLNFGGPLFRKRSKR